MEVVAASFGECFVHADGRVGVPGDWGAEGHNQCVEDGGN